MKEDKDKDKDFICYDPTGICPLHKRMRDAETEAAIAREGVNPESEAADNIRCYIREHGKWRLTDTPCGI